MRGAHSTASRSQQGVLTVFFCVMNGLPHAGGVGTANDVAGRIAALETANPTRSARSDRRHACHADRVGNEPCFGGCASSLFNSCHACAGERGMPGIFAMTPAADDHAGGAKADEDERAVGKRASILMAAARLSPS